MDVNTGIWGLKLTIVGTADIGKKLCKEEAGHYLRKPRSLSAYSDEERSDPEHGPVDRRDVVANVPLRSELTKERLLHIHLYRNIKSIEMRYNTTPLPIISPLLFFPYITTITIIRGHLFMPLTRKSRFLTPSPVHMSLTSLPLLWTSTCRRHEIHITLLK